MKYFPSYFVFSLKTLEELDLGWNEIGMESITYLYKALEHNTVSTCN